MPTQTSWFGIALLGVIVASTGRAYADTRPTFVLPVTIQNYANVPDAVVNDARQQTSQIFRTIGVLLEWGTATDKGLRIVILPPAMAARLPASDDALGMTPVDVSGAGRRGYVFAERVQTAAHALHMELAHLLGCAMAHELGHMLLPRHPHSETGIMRATWDPAHLSIGTSDYLQFTPWQADWIRRRVSDYFAGGPTVRRSS